jgi:hypothetical protein
VREREREKEREGERERKRGREREERERYVEYVFQLSRIAIFIFKRNDGALESF